MKSTILGGFVSCRVMVSNLKELSHVQGLFESLGYRTGAFTVSCLPDYIVTCSDVNGEYTSRLVYDSDIAVWAVEALEDYVKSQIKQRDQKQNLAVLNGEEALKLYMKGLELEVTDLEDDYVNVWLPVTDVTVLGTFLDQRYKFRVKPEPKIETVEITLNIPKPFTPECGEKFYYLTNVFEKGYSSATHTMGHQFYQHGAWRTEDEIKLVVKATRKIQELADE